MALPALALSSTALADAIDLSWEAPLECPARSSILEGLERLQPSSESNTVQAQVNIRQAHGAWIAKLDTPSGSRLLEGKTCLEVSEAVTVIPSSLKRTSGRHLIAPWPEIHSRPTRATGNIRSVRKPRDDAAADPYLDHRLRVIELALEPALTLARAMSLPLDDLVNLLQRAYFRQFSERGLSFTAIAQRLGKSRRTVAKLAHQVRHATHHPYSDQLTFRRLIRSSCRNLRATAPCRSRGYCEDFPAEHSPTCAKP